MWCLKIMFWVQVMWYLLWVRLLENLQCWCSPCFGLWCLVSIHFAIGNRDFVINFIGSITSESLPPAPFLWFSVFLPFFNYFFLVSVHKICSADLTSDLQFWKSIKCSHFGTWNLCCVCTCTQHRFKTRTVLWTSFVSSPEGRLGMFCLTDVFPPSGVSGLWSESMLVSPLLFFSLFLLLPLFSANGSVPRIILSIII